MNKAELIDAISTRTNRIAPKSAIEVILTAAIDEIVEAVESGDRVKIIGFGTFEARTRKEREGRNPLTGDKLVIPPTTIPYFSGGKMFRKRLNG